MRSTKSTWTALVVLIIGIPSAAVAVDKDLQEYAEACDLAIGETVKQFSCSSGTVLPMIGVAGGDCEKPPYLPGAGCFENSRIGQQTGTPAKVGIVYFCRHKNKVGSGSSSTKYADIAVIQTNYDSGATCFYQQLAGSESLQGTDVPPPSSGEFWMTPTLMATKGNACIQCHDSGPFLRTPYVKQAGLDALHKSHRNKTNYWFPGQAFHGWNGMVYQVRLEADTSCSGSCHIMGANAMNPGFGTSSWLGLMATGHTATPHLDGGTFGDLAFWMKPFRSEPNPDDQHAAESLADCAVFGPHSGCSLVPWGGQLMAVPHLDHYEK